MTRSDIAAGYIAASCIGLGLLGLSPGGLLVAFTAMAALDTGHAVAPVTAAWLHPGFRSVMSHNRMRYVGLPLGILGVTLTIGWLTETGFTSFDPVATHQMFRLTDWRNPFPALMWAYWGWNIWHFGMQNYGVACLCGLPRHRWACIGTTAFAMAALPLMAHTLWLFLLMTGVVSLNHWLVELGLTAKISEHPALFLLPVLTFGCVAFLWTIPTPEGTMVRMIPLLLAARAGLGFVHFLYDRWIYRFSDPMVGETIGKSVFASAPVSPTPRYDVIGAVSKRISRS